MLCAFCPKRCLLPGGSDRLYKESVKGVCTVLCLEYKKDKRVCVKIMFRNVKSY